LPLEQKFPTVRDPAEELNLRSTILDGEIVVPRPRIATLTMVFKRAAQAQQHWRRLNGSELISKVVTGAIFVDGEEITEQAP